MAQPAGGQRIAASGMREIVVSLCAIKPLSTHQLARLLDRSAAHISEVASQLVAAGRLRRRYPDRPSHPKQQYLTATRADAVTDFNGL